MFKWPVSDNDKISAGTLPSLTPIWAPARTRNQTTVIGPRTTIQACQSTCSKQALIQVSLSHQLQRQLQNNNLKWWENPLHNSKFGPMRPLPHKALIHARTFQLNCTKIDSWLADRQAGGTEPYCFPSLLLLQSSVWKTWLDMLKYLKNQ